MFGATKGGEMAEERILKKNLEVRLKTVEEQLDDIFSRIGLLDEQARQAGYRAWLATGQGGPAGLNCQGNEGSQREMNRKLVELKSTATTSDHRDGRIASRRAAQHRVEGTRGLTSRSGG